MALLWWLVATQRHHIILAHGSDRLMVVVMVIAQSHTQTHSRPTAVVINALRWLWWLAQVRSRLALAMPHHLERLETPLRVVSALVGLCAAGLWFLSASVPIPLAPGAAIGGTLPTDPFNEAIRQSASLNQWAALVTGLSVFLTVAAECVRLLARRS